MSEKCINCGTEIEEGSFSVRIAGKGVVCSENCFDSIMFKDCTDRHDETTKTVPNDSTIFHG